MESLTPKRDAFTVLSYNIHKGFSARYRRFVLPDIREALRAIDADIVLLQEVQGKHHKSRLKKFAHADLPQTEFIAESKWPHYMYGRNAVYGSAHHGNALLSNFPFKMVENINVSLSQRASRSILHAIIDYEPTVELHVICIHLGLFRAERDYQLITLSKRIEAHVPSHAPLIIAGDFNDWRRGAFNYMEKELELKEVYKVLEGKHAKTYPASRPTLEVDRIYYRGLKLLSGEIFNENYWKKLSDHLPLHAKFAIE
ncbi:endonuclease/exonuclease/phosphatase family protein [Coxiella burnetii]|uniref:endonuclease/exonuclease/phosphatase family protein n=1 Tax=Coxiella burnetii TaxID=777 RepID=UPI0000DAE97C|nr:endonuclease/exonuclease/phosphatase family protein [Coxiella burnetii]ABX77709.1 endonuclease/exonuclease/phosphatase family protein [Coxiella burnetii RSA 331]ATN82024.1 hypothetical protein AYO24_04810 [Coxiella burnetii]ATN83926.1 hypothetical protein AYO23_04825 [Coxiella burnetii]POZ79371.1 hypothetical protein CbuRSA461_04965 [Coxiella burnetii]